MYTSSRPSVAPYPRALPGANVTQARSNSSADARSRMNLLRTRKQAPDPVTNFTASSHHPAATGYPTNDHGFHLTGEGVSNGGPGNAAAAARHTDAVNTAPAESYVRNLREQVNVLQSEVAMYKSGKPVVETHQCDLMEELQVGAKTAAERAKQTESKMQEEAQTVASLRREVHDMRKMVANERATNQSVTDERTYAMRQRDELDKARQKTEMIAAHTAKRLEALENELQYVKRELASSKQKEVDFIAHSTGGVGATTSTSADGAVVVNGVVPPHIAQRVVTQYQTILTERNTFEAERDEFKRQAEERGVLIEELTATLTASQKETASLVDHLRHEQQRYHLLLANTQSDRVALDDATRELAFLKLANRELTIDRDRLSIANDDLFAKIRAMIDERQVSDLAIANTLEATKHLQTETRHVHDSLIEEQSVTNNLREEVHRMVSELEAARKLGITLEAKIKESTTENQKQEATYNERVKQLETALKNLQQSHTQAHTAELQSLQSATALLESLRRGEHATAASTNAAAPAAAVSPVPVASPAAAAPLPAAAVGTAAALTAAQPAAQPAATAAVAAKPGPTVSNLFDAAKAAMEREKVMRQEAAAAVAAAGRAMIARKAAEGTAAPKPAGALASMLSSLAAPTPKP